jgi:hypothetical protein
VSWQQCVEAISMTSEPELRKFTEAEPLRLGVVSDYI